MFGFVYPSPFKADARWLAFLGRLCGSYARRLSDREHCERTVDTE